MSQQNPSICLGCFCSNMSCPQAVVGVSPLKVDVPKLSCAACGRCCACCTSLSWLQQVCDSWVGSATLSSLELSKGEMGSVP